MECANNDVCDICKGNKTIDSPNYKIIEVCPKCGGLGRMDWITTAMGQNKLSFAPNKDIQNALIYRNISVMIQAIKHQYRLMDINIDVKLKEIPSQSYSVDYIFKGGF